MGKKKLVINEFCIEITRKCNMKCEHCLRGDAQNIDIKNEYITKALEDIDTIGSFTITGGEPSLNIDAIQFILDELKRLKIPVEMFYIVLNGRKTCQNEKLLVTLLRLYQYQNSDIHSIGSMVQISRDEYHTHPKEQKESISYLSSLSFFSVRDNDYSKMNNVISEGRGYLLGGHKQVTYDNTIRYEICDEFIEVETMIYLNAKGQICNDCDYSYDSQDEYYLFDMNKTTLLEGILNK